MATLGLRAGSIYRVECFMRDGRLRWALELPNVVFDVGGRNDLLNVMFNAATQSTAWYISLVDNGSFTGYVQATDTMASHGGWIENSNYNAATRVVWTPSGAAAIGSIDNSPGGTFNFTTTETIRGAFLVDQNTKGGTTGFLYGAVDFGAPRSVFSGDSMRVMIALTV